MLGAGILVAVVVLPTASAADSVAVPVLTVTVIASVTFRKTDGAAATWGGGRIVNMLHFLAFPCSSKSWAQNNIGILFFHKLVLAGHLYSCLDITR